MRHNTVIDLLSAQANISAHRVLFVCVGARFTSHSMGGFIKFVGVGGRGVLGALTDNDIFILVVNIFYIAGPLGPLSRSNSELDPIAF